MGPPLNSGAGRAAAARDGVIEMRLESLDRLFDPVDPSPFGEQDLSQWAAEYIVESVKEMKSPEPRALELLVAGHTDSSRDAATETAVHRYFARQATVRQRSLRRLLTRGVITLAIGVTFLVAFFGVSHLIGWLLGDGPITTLLREGSLIVGWVAMWRPMEIFLYDWWPIVGERRLHDRLSRINVRVVASPSPSATGASGGRPGQAAARSIERWENEGGRIPQRDPRGFGEQSPNPPALRS